MNSYNEENEENKHRKWYDIGRFDITHDSYFTIEILGHTHYPFHVDIKDNMLNISGCSDYNVKYSINENKSTELIMQISGYSMLGSINKSCSDIYYCADIDISDIKTLHIIQHWYENLRKNVVKIKQDTIHNEEEIKTIDISWRFKIIPPLLKNIDDDW
jgi:hypothetical protein